MLANNLTVFLSLLMNHIYRTRVAFGSAFQHSYLPGRGLNVDLGVEDIYISAVCEREASASIIARTFKS